MAEASTTSPSATTPAKFFTRGIEGRENLLVGYLAGREVTQTRVPLRAAACGEFATKRGLREVRNAQTGSASLSRQVIWKVNDAQRADPLRKRICAGLLVLAPSNPT